MISKNYLQQETVVEKKQSYTEYLEQLQDYLQDFLLDRPQAIDSDEDEDDLEYDHDDDDWRDIMKQLQEEQQKHDDVDPPLVVVVSSNNREQQAATTTSITETKKKRRGSLFKPFRCLQKVVVWPFKFESKKGARKSGKKK